MHSVDSVSAIRSMAERVARSYGLELFDVQVRRESRGLVVRVLIDRPGPAARPEESVGIEDCERISRDLSTMLDVEDPLADPYTLEVSSPGLDRPLRHIEDYRRFLGRMASIVVSRAVDGQMHFKGRLQAVVDDEVVIETRHGRTHRVPLDAVTRARLEVEF